MYLEENISRGQIKDYDNITAIKVRRKDNHSVYYIQRGMLQRHTCYDRGELMEFERQEQAEEIRIQRIEVEQLYTITLTINGDVYPHSLYISGHEMSDLRAGKPVRDVGKIYWVTSDALHLLDQFELYKVNFYLPHELFFQAVKLTDQAEEANERFERFGTLEITSELRKFWQPKAILRFTNAEVRKMYRRFRLRPARQIESGATLRDEMMHLKTIAKNYSRNQSDPVTVCVARDGVDSFYFYFLNKDGRRVGFNGGIIFHGDGCYQIHT